MNNIVIFQRAMRMVAAHPEGRQLA